MFRVILPVADIEAAATFYARLLGMPGSRVSSGRHYFDCGGVILAVIDVTQGGLTPTPGPKSLYFAVTDLDAVHARAKQDRPNPEHVYFSVDDLDAAHERARDAGGRELTAIQVRPWGERSFYAHDPFGNPICFVDSRTLFTGGRREVG